MRIIDLSVALKAGIASDPPSMLPKIEYLDHKQGADDFALMFPGLKPQQLPEGEGPAMERITFTTHNGTHLDAPWHFASTMDGGKPAMKADEIPLEWCFSPGVNIVLVNTAAGGMYGQPNFLDKGCGMGREATLFLLRQGVRVTGTDGWSWDAPFSFTAKRFLETGDPGLIWEGHKAGRDIGYCHMEKLNNLDQLPPFGFKVCCFPVKIEAASAGWTRCVALLDT